jgi:hypothetical protein
MAYIKIDNSSIKGFVLQYESFIFIGSIMCIQIMAF